MQEELIKAFWQEFLLSANKDAATKYIDCFYFGMDEEWANKLLDLVLMGKKRATTSSLFACEKEFGRIPQAGDYSIVTDWDGNPRCVIQTAAVIVLPFNEMTFEICRREGEDDTLESWQNAHRRFFTAEGQELGYEFSAAMPVVFEDFAVVFAEGLL